MGKTMGKPTTPTGPPEQLAGLSTARDLWRLITSRFGDDQLASAALISPLSGRLFPFTARSRAT